MSNFLLFITPLLFLVIPTIALRSFLKRFKIDFSKLETGFMSLFLGQIFLVSFIFVLSLFLGLAKGTVFIALLLFLIADIPPFVKKNLSIRLNFKFEKYEKIFLTMLLIIGIGFLFLLRRHMVPEDVNGLSTSHNTYGDIQYHLAIINSFFLGDNFPPKNPIYPMFNLSYPFMIDFYTSVFRTVGLNLQSSLIIPGLIFGICLFAFFLLFSFRFLKNSIGAIVSSLIFIFNGGLGGYLILKESLNSDNFLKSLPGNFSLVIDKYNFRFPNGVSSVFMAERPILVGIAAFFIVLILLWIAFEKEKAQNELLLAGLIIGLLPLWHTHTIIVFGLLLPFYFLAYWIFNKTSFLKSLKFILPILYFSVPIGVLGLLWHLPQVFGGGEHFFSVDLGWIVGIEGYYEFWLRNLGLFIFLLPFGFILLNKKQKLFYLPIFLLFIFSSVFRFQPFDWDNYKVLLVWYAASSIVFAKLIVELYTKLKFAGQFFAILILFFSITSGALLIAGDYLTFYGLFSREDIEMADWEIMNTGPHDLILTGPQHNQFSILAGRKILMGYPGYLWTQGIDSGPLGEEIRKMYHGDIELIRKYDIKFIVLGYEEKRAYSPDENFLNKNFPLVKETRNFKIYKVI